MPVAELIAGAFLSSLFQVIFTKLASGDFSGYIRKGSAEKLQITLNSINQLLEDAETKQYQNMFVKKWLNELKHEVYEVEKLLDEIATKMQKKGKVQRLFSSFTDPFKSRIKHLLENLEYLAKQKDDLGLTHRSCTSKVSAVSSQFSKRLPTGSLMDEPFIYGRDNDKNKIINYLLSDNDKGKQVTILSIVGLGGMGKTSLAQLVYNDKRMDKQFELKAWVYVSESFDVVGITKTILKKFNSSADNEDFDLLQLQLQQTLASKKCLFVLDDVWNVSEESWEKLLLPFNRVSSGSKIIVTTRDKYVAKVIKSNQQHHLKQLEESDCWHLFVKHAFQGRDISQYPDLELIGKKIVKKCGGLPLAVKILGNLLQRNFSQGEWSKILETDMWHLSERDNNINPTLRLSYHNLPSIQKRCFAYCSIFPKGYKFQKDELIKFWMADGLLNGGGISKRDEELGDEVFNDLESISFFQESFNRYEQGFVMHNLVNDLAKSMSREFCMQINGVKVEGISIKTRHIQCSLQLSCVDKILEPICKLEGLRSLMLKGNRNTFITKNVQHDIFSKLKCLRMLSFRYCGLSKLEKKISKLKLLRYLDLSYTEITSLPDSICKMFNLQTLLLNQCRLTEFPSKFSELINLRHLEFPQIRNMPQHIGNLKNLQNLNFFVVKKHTGFDLKELGKLNHLHGKIHIEGLGNVIDSLDVATSILKDKKYLEEVDMKFDGKIEEMDGSKVGKVWEALQPNRNLKRLIIRMYKGNSFSYWLSGDHLPNLVSLRLINCKLVFLSMSLWKLPSLKELFISNCGGIKTIGEESYDNHSTFVPLRSLEILKFESMYDWEEWYCPKGFLLLKELYINNCPKLKRGLPQHLPSLQILKISDCKELKASIPKYANIMELDFKRCGSILVSELPSTLKKCVLVENSYIELSVCHNNTCLEELKIDFRHYVECPSLNLHCYNSLGTLSLKGCVSSSLPFALHLFTNLYSLKLIDWPRLKSFPPGGLPSNLHSLNLYNCPQLESFPRGGLPSNLSILVIRSCHKLIASRENWGLFQLNSLKKFIVSDDFENVVSFPEERLLPPTLEYLSLSECSKLTIMNGMGLLHLNSLNFLHIYNCPVLKYLPKDDLPNSLSTLLIHNCKLLKQLYQSSRYTLKDIIPHVKID